MRFQVPQFIETESKIIGQFTLKQFLYLAGGGIVIFIFRYVFSSLFIFALASLMVAALALALAFLKIDGIPLPKYLIMAASFSLGVKKYIFRKEEDTTGTLPLKDV